MTLNDRPTTVIPANMPSAVDRPLPPAVRQYFARPFYGGPLSAPNATVGLPVDQ
jgi:hypothetical protein